MDLQPENDSDLNVAKDCRRQQRKGKGMRSSALQTEQQMSSGEMEFQNASEDLQGNDESHRKGGTFNRHKYNCSRMYSGMQRVGERVGN